MSYDRFMFTTINHEYIKKDLKYMNIMFSRVFLVMVIIKNTLKTKTIDIFSNLVLCIHLPR